MTAWRSGPLIQNGVNGNLFLKPYGKGWTARMAGYRRTLSTALPQRRLGHGASPPHPYPKLGLPTLLARSRGNSAGMKPCNCNPTWWGAPAGWVPNHQVAAFPNCSAFCRPTSWFLIPMAVNRAISMWMPGLRPCWKALEGDRDANWAKLRPEAALAARRVSVMVAMGIKTTVVILHRPSRRDWKTSSRVRIGFQLPCHSKAFQKFRTAIEEGSSVSSGVAPWIPAKAGMTARGAGMMGRERGMTAWCSDPLIQNWG